VLHTSPLDDYAGRWRKEIATRREKAIREKVGDMYLRKAETKGGLCSAGRRPMHCDIGLTMIAQPNQSRMQKKTK